jgi:hypothetical protein
VNEDTDDPIEAAQQEVAEKRLVEALDREGEIHQLAALLQNEGLRDFLWRVLEKCGIYSEPFDASYGKTGYNLGRGSVGRWLLIEIAEADPDAMVRMQLKSNRLAKQKADERRRESLRRRPRS